MNYSVDPAGMFGDTMRLPQVSWRMSRGEVLQARGADDTLALRHKFHDEKMHNRHTPPGEMVRDLCEAMGAKS